MTAERPGGAPARAEAVIAIYLECLVGGLLDFTQRNSIAASVANLVVCQPNNGASQLRAEQLARQNGPGSRADTLIPWTAPPSRRRVCASCS